MAALFVNNVDQIVGATLTNDEFAAIGPFLADPKGQQAILELFGGLIRQLSVDRRRAIIDRLAKTLETASDARLAELDQVIASRG
jgi:hypothetical protein